MSTNKLTKAQKEAVKQAIIKEMEEKVLQNPMVGAMVESQGIDFNAMKFFVNMMLDNALKRME